MSSTRTAATATAAIRPGGPAVLLLTIAAANAVALLVAVVADYDRDVFRRAELAEDLRRAERDAARALNLLWDRRDGGTRGARRYITKARVIDALSVLGADELTIKYSAADIAGRIKSDFSDGRGNTED